MGVQIVLDLPEDAFSALRRSPEEFAGEMRLAAAVKWHEIGLISQAKAAEIAGVSRHAFLEALAHFGVSPFQLTSEELRREM
jgi:predicted HTH domain antitoxin